MVVVVVGGDGGYMMVVVLVVVGGGGGGVVPVLVVVCMTWWGHFQKQAFVCRRLPMPAVLPQPLLLLDFFSTDRPTRADRVA